MSRNRARLSDVSIARPVLAWVIMFALIVFGSVALGRLGVSYMPDVDFPVLSVSVNWEGAAPEIMEAEIVDRLERRLITVEGLKEMTSGVSQGSASITLEFTIDRNIDAALQEVQTAISRLEMPTDVRPPTVRKSNPEESPIMWLGLYGEIPERDLFVLADNMILDRLQLLDGVGEVFVGGDMERNLRVWADNRKLKEYQLTILDVEQALLNDHVEGAAGYLENTQTERNLRVLGEAASPESIRNIRINSRGGAPIYFSDIRLRDVARVDDGLNDHRRITRVDGKRGISIGIRKQIGANTVAVGDRVIAGVDAIQKELPEGITLQVNFDSTRFVKEAVDETQFTLLLSAILTALVCWFFLGNFHSTLNVILSIPTSIIGTFLILYFLDFTLNLFTLLGLSL
ncbi:MAG: efflux RND transporter permease subunit, partial [Leptospiraceae bacterium]|nr:efflux RND transporter permease subunit [Leptospiraceae bacterium]